MGWPTHYIPRVNSPGEPPPRAYLTSLRYPYELYDELESSASLMNVTPGIELDAEIESSGSFISGVIVETTFKDFAFEEEIESTGSFISGGMETTIFHDFAFEEEIESVGSFVSGAVTEPLIYYLNWPLVPDELESEGSFISGVLT